MRFQHRGPVELMQLELPGGLLELGPDLWPAGRRPHVRPQHLKDAPGDSLRREISSSFGIEQRVIDDQQLAARLDLRHARREVEKEPGMMRQREPRRDRHLRVDHVGKATIDRCADQRIDQRRPVQERALQLQQCSAITASGLRPNLLRDRAPGSAGQAQVADDHDIVGGSRHRSSIPAVSAQVCGAADQGAISSSRIRPGFAS